MTVEMLRDFGATVHVDAAKKTWRVEPGALQGKDLMIEPDLSNAAPFLSIAMVCGGSITIADWPEKTTQPGDQLRTLLRDMGASISLNSDGLTLTSNSEKSSLRDAPKIIGVDVDLHDVGELTPSIAYEDHRLATAGAVIGLVIAGIEVENIGTTRKTLTDFPGLWKSLVE